MRKESGIKHTNKARMSALLRKALGYSTQVGGVIESRTYEVPEASLLVAGDAKYQNMVSKKIAHLTNVEHVVLVGIGGSSLGTEAIWEALAHTTKKQLHIIDAIEPERLVALGTLIKGLKKKESIALIIISKSGGTTETMVNGVEALTLGVARFGNSFMEQVVIIGTSDTELMKAGKKQGAVCIPFPEVIGGRYSVFTAVGIVPLTLLGIDTNALRKGAMSGVQEQNRTMVASDASLLALLAEEGVHTVNFFTFNARLQKLGEWYRQLLAESNGKPITKQKKQFTHQLLPTVSSSIDLHSMAQLYLGGYTGMFTHFVFGETGDKTVPLPRGHWLIGHMEYVGGKTPLTVKDSIRKGVIEAYTEAGLPFRVTELDSITPYELGYFMASSMFEVMTLCHLFGIDAFNQPQVELYKKHTRALLNS